MRTSSQLLRWENSKAANAQRLTLTKQSERVGTPGGLEAEWKTVPDLLPFAWTTQNDLSNANNPPYMSSQKKGKISVFRFKKDIHINPPYNLILLIVPWSSSYIDLKRHWNHKKPLRSEMIHLKNKSPNKISTTYIRNSLSTFPR